MDGDNEFQQQQQQPQEPIEQTEESYDPVDIAEAFKMARSLDKETANPSVEAPEVPEQTTGTSEGYEPSGYSEPQQPDNSGYTSGGGATTSFSSYDYNSKYKQIGAAMQQQAMAATKKILEQKGYKRATMDMLAVRDEETGDILFRDPDKGNKTDRYGNKAPAYFNSRSEANAWVRDFNQQLDEKTKEIYKQEYQKVYNAQLPTIKLMQFAPKLDKMNDVQIDLLNGLIEPYELKDNNGNVYGYSCDLDRAYTQAMNMFNRMGSKYSKQRAAQQQPQQEVRRPAVDMKSGGNTTGSIPDNETFDDVKDLSQAFVRLRQMKGKK